ncbi:hypothetical protein AKAW_04816 [Aspergillus luchuensis IFO 4308]|nr:hypothetical protein AKAW_04816 [Aspergillus luchuensis IFO 4308]
MSSTTPQPDSTTTKPKYNLRNPLPLSAAQEAEVKQLYYKRVRSLCAPEIKGENHPPYTPIPIPISFPSSKPKGKVIRRMRRQPHNNSNMAHAKPEVEDRAREEWFATHEERRKAKEEELAKVERRREEVIRMMREDQERQAAAAKAAAEKK